MKGSRDFAARVHAAAAFLSFLLQLTTKSSLSFFRTLIASYFKIVQVNFADLVPKTIMQFMVLNVKNSVESELVRRLYKRDLFDELLVEDRGVAQRRKEARSMLELLEKAEEIVAEIRDFSAFT